MYPGYLWFCRLDASCVGEYLMELRALGILPLVSLRNLTL